MTRYQQLRKAGMCTRDCGRRGASGPNGPRSECKQCRESSHGSGNKRKSKRQHHKMMTGGKAAQTVASILQACSEIEYVGLAGWPDLFFIRKNGSAEVVEVKDRDKLSSKQKRCHEALASLGVVVQVLSPQTAKTIYNGQSKQVPPMLKKPVVSTRALVGSVMKKAVQA